MTSNGKKQIITVAIAKNMCGMFLVEFFDQLVKVNTLMQDAMSLDMRLHA